jgi:Maf-like protein
MATDTAEQQAEGTAGAAQPQEQQQQGPEANGAAQPQWEAAQQPVGAGPAAQRPAWASLPIILGSQSASRRGLCWVSLLADARCIGGNSHCRIINSHGLMCMFAAAAAIMDDLAAQLGFSYSTVAAGIDEKLIRDDDPEELVMRLAHAKAMAIAERWKEEDAMPSEGEPRAEDLHWKLKCSILCAQPRSQDLHPVAAMETCCICCRRVAHHMRSGRRLRWRGAGEARKRGAGTRLICSLCDRQCVDMQTYTFHPDQKFGSEVAAYIHTFHLYRHGSTSGVTQTAQPRRSARCGSQTSPLVVRPPALTAAR